MNIERLESFVSLWRELEGWCKQHVKDVDDMLCYCGNDEEGYFVTRKGFEFDETKIPIPHDLNLKFLQFAGDACGLFISTNFRIDHPTISRVKADYPDINFRVFVGERDSFGPVTYCISTNYFQIVIV